MGPFTKYFSYAGELTEGFEYSSGGYAISMEGLTGLNLGGRLAYADVLPYRLLLVLTIPMPRALAPPSSPGRRSRMRHGPQHDDLRQLVRHVRAHRPNLGLSPSRTVDAPPTARRRVT